MRRLLGEGGNLWEPVGSERLFKEHRSAVITWLVLGVEGRGGGC